MSVPAAFAGVHRTDQHEPAGKGDRSRCAGDRDLAVFNDDSSRRRVTELMRTAAPDIVLTASPVDYHCDHEATSSLVRDACFAAPAPNYKAGSAPVLRAIPHLYFLDPDGITVEYSYGMEEFPEEEARDARMLPAKPESIDFWGAQPVKGFATVGAIEQMQLEPA